ncbi:MAG: V-type ATP synthase subunit F [Planctomycetota bacterium]|jgi:vacuolar-type H+-ATPase subunit F/Vma7
MVNASGPRLVILAPPTLSAGFRMAGVATIEVEDVPHTEATLRTLLEHGERGVIGVFAPYLESLPAGLRARLEFMAGPVVVPFPTGLAAETPDSVEARRARLGALLQRAVGYHIVFEQEAG